MRSRIQNRITESTTRQVDQMAHTEAFADLPQLGAAGCNETAQQPIPAEPLHPVLPEVGAAI
jgi:hypothetical protein